MRLDRASNTFSLIQERAEVVRRVFTMLADGVGKHSIAATFNREGVPTFGDNGTKRRAEMWHRPYIAKIATNPAVVGTLIPHEVQHGEGGRKNRKPLEAVTGYYPAVVDEDLFNRVQAQHQTGRAPVVRGEGSAVRNLLAGLAKCPKCGGSMTRVAKGNPKKAGVPKLVCVKAKTGGGCHYVSVRLDWVEDSLLRVLADRAMVVPSGDDTLDNEIEHIEVTLHGLDTLIENYLDALGGSPSPALTKRLRDAEAERDRL